MPTSYPTFHTVIVIHRFNGAAESVHTEAYNDNDAVLTVAEYRRLMDDQVSSNEHVQERINYLVRLTRKNIQIDLKNYVGKRK